MDESFGSSSQEILKFLECPVCFETVYSPIFQCKNGHIICSRCKDVIRNICPICQVEMDDTTSSVLERFLPLIKLPCTYGTNGCNEIVEYDQAKQLKHEKDCKYRPYRCPYMGFSSPPCDTEGDISMLLSHLQSSHKLTFNNQSEFLFQLPLFSLDSTQSTKGYKCFDQHFCLHFETCNSIHVIMAYVTVMGDETLAMKYRYSLTVAAGDTEMNWKGSPMSIRETKEGIWKSGNALFVHQRAMSFFRRFCGPVIKGKIWPLNRDIPSVEWPVLRSMLRELEIFRFRRS